MAWLIRRLTKRTIGASSSFGSERIGAHQVGGADLLLEHRAQRRQLAVGAVEAVDGCAQVRCLGDHASCTCIREIERTSSIAKTLPASAMASTRVGPELVIGSTS